LTGVVVFVGNGFGATSGVCVVGVGVTADVHVERTLHVF